MHKITFIFILRLYYIVVPNTIHSKFRIVYVASGLVHCRSLYNIHFCSLSFFLFCYTAFFGFFAGKRNLILVFYLCSTADWRFAADQFVRLLPDKVIVHCKLFFIIVSIVLICCSMQLSKYFLLPLLLALPLFNSFLKSVKLLHTN